LHPACRFAGISLGRLSAAVASPRHKGCTKGLRGIAGDDAPLMSKGLIKKDMDIEIKGYKSIKDQRIELKNINILIGANGSGKSNFLSFFEFLNRLCNRCLAEHIALKGGRNKILHKGKQVTGKLSFKIRFDNGHAYAVTLAAGEFGFIFVDEAVDYSGFGNENIWNIGYSNTESMLKIIDNYKTGYIIKYFDGLRKHHFSNTGGLSPFTNMSNIENDIYYLYGNGENLAACLYHIQKKNMISYNHIVSIIQSIAPYFSDFILQPNENNWLKLQWKGKYSDMVYGVNDLSDGTVRFIALTVLFMQPDLPKTIIIDEPELGLHPDAIAKLAGMIRSAAARDCQIIIATQSADLISHFQPEDIITVDLIKGETIFKRLDSESLSVWLEIYTIDDLWKRNIIPSGQLNYS
jgi:predicted ATPase